MKGCLKLPTPLLTPGLCRRKSVAFGTPGTDSPDLVFEEVFIADEWDRTPAEPSLKLTYQDLLELKEIQRSLPRANQVPDPYARRPASHYLSRVPIGLLPLLPETPPNSSNVTPTSTPHASPTHTPPTPASPVPHSTPPLPTSSTLISPTPSPLTPPAWNPARPTPVRPRPSFTFLPLLDTPVPPAPPVPPPSPPPTDSESEDHDPPTPALTSASSGGSPLSRASSTSPEPPLLTLPLRRLDAPRTPTSASAPGAGSSKGANAYSIGDSEYSSNKYPNTSDVSDSYFPPCSPRTPKPSSPAITSPSSVPSFDGFILNGDVDDDFDTLRRASFRSPPTSHTPPSIARSNPHPCSQPHINKTPSWAKCAPPPQSTGILFKRAWVPKSQREVVVHASTQRGGSVPWSG